MIRSAARRALAAAAGATPTTTAPSAAATVAASPAAAASVGPAGAAVQGAARLLSTAATTRSPLVLAPARAQAAGSGLWLPASATRSSVGGAYIPARGFAVGTDDVAVPAVVASDESGGEEIEGEFGLGDAEGEGDDHFPMPPGVRDEYATSDSEGEPAGPMGDNFLRIPEDVLEHWADPLLFNSNSSDARLKAVNQNDGVYKTAELRGLNERRKELRKMFEEGQTNNRPVWSLTGLLLQVDTVQKVTRGGNENSSRALVMVGNRNGGIGFGMGKHHDATEASRLAFRRARRDMVFLPTHNGHLYHDMVGKANRTSVIIRKVPDRIQSKGNPLVEMAMQLAGVKHFSAKVTGSKHCNRMILVQALLDAFARYQSPEENAQLRGKRVVYASADRRFKGDIYPFFPRGPSYQPRKK